MRVLKHLFASVIIASHSHAQTITETFGSGTNQFSIEFVQIGNSGNAGNNTTGRSNPIGAVSYVYNLGKYEVSRDMVLKASTAGGLGLTLADMTGFGGNGLNRPATGISWNQAARFVNWLNSSQGYQVAYNFLTSGPNDNIAVWGSGEYAGTNQFRHKDAYYFLPSLDEWYKGAYGSGFKDALGGFGWLSYPTENGGIPVPVSGGTTPGTAVYGQPLASGPSDIKNAGGPSWYGTVAQGGNVMELIESTNDLLNDTPDKGRSVYGGFWTSDETFAPEVDGLEPSDMGLNVGFRVASVPEPSALSLLAVGLGGLTMIRRRRS